MPPFSTTTGVGLIWSYFMGHPWPRVFFVLFPGPPVAARFFLGGCSGATVAAKKKNWAVLGASGRRSIGLKNTTGSVVQVAPDEAALGSC